MNIHPVALALAMHITKRIEESPENTLEDMVISLISDKPELDVDYALSQQIDDLIDLTTIPCDRIRVIMMVAMPSRKGAMFSARDLGIPTARLSIDSPLHHIAKDLVSDLNKDWPRFRNDLDRPVTSTKQKHCNIFER
jgi:hypothetical protein